MKAGLPTTRTEPQATPARLEPQDSGISVRHERSWYRLPERAEQGRNYDYRYCWIRDQCYAGQAVAAAGAHPLLDDAVRFVSERVLADGPDLKPAYCVTGDRPPEEEALDLPGYPGAAVKTGNWVTDQFHPDERPLGEAEGAFLLCGFLMALADHHQGNELAAVRWFERNRTACGPPGLFTEEFDIGSIAGNLP